MTKNKRQLRSEAVERLKMLDVKYAFAGDVFGAVLGDYDDNGYNYEGEVAALIDFLRDDEPTNGIDSETNGIHATFPLIGDPPNGDALEIMRSLRGCVNMPMFKDTLCRETTTSNVIAALETLADMVERDYIRREDCEITEKLNEQAHEMNDALGRENTRLEGLVGKLESERDEKLSLLETAFKRCKELEAERDELQRKLEILKAHGVEIVDAVAGGFEVYNEAIRERDKWKTKCKTREFAYKQANAERKRYSEQIDGLRTERDEWKAKADDAQAYIDQCWSEVIDGYEKNTTNLEAEIDELRAERNEAIRAMKAAQDAMERARDERDEWKAKAEGSSKVRAGSSKRAAAVERLRTLDAYTAGLESIVDELARGVDTDRLNYHVEIEHIIDLLTDDDGLRSNDGVVRSNLEWMYDTDCVFQTVCAMFADHRVIAMGVDDESGSAHDWLMAPHVDAQRDGDVTPSKPIGQFNASKSEETAGIHAAKGDIRDFDDSREKLEANIWAGCDHLTMVERGEVLVNVPWRKLLGWLDLLEAIVEREFAGRYCRECQAAEAMELKAERDYWRGQTLACVVSATKRDGFAGGVMLYPREEGFAEPSLLVTDALDSLRDFNAECADCAVKRANVVLSESVDRLTRERDALADDLADATNGKEL